MGKKEIVENALSICKGLRGVREAYVLDGKIREEILEEEKKVMAAGGTGVDNQGIKEAFSREYVIAIIKDPRFRPPPEPTVLMLSGDKVAGIEVFPWTSKEYEGRDDVIWLSDGFVVLTNQITDKPARFIMPPVSFPELNPSNGCTDVVSCSPAPTSDLMMRKYEGLEDDGKLASVLIGFNVKED